MSLDFNLVLILAHDKERYKSINASEKHIVKGKMNGKRGKPGYKPPSPPPVEDEGKAGETQVQAHPPPPPCSPNSVSIHFQSA